MTATCIKVQDAQPMVAYQRTAIDDRKDAAALLLQSCSPYVVLSRVPLVGRGITAMHGSHYKLTDSAWNRLKGQYTWATDF